MIIRDINAYFRLVLLERCIKLHCFFSLRSTARDSNHSLNMSAQITLGRLWCCHLLPKGLVPCWNVLEENMVINWYKWVKSLWTMAMVIDNCGCRVFLCFSPSHNVWVIPLKEPSSSSKLLLMDAQDAEPLSSLDMCWMGSIKESYTGFRRNTKLTCFINYTARTSSKLAYCRFYNGTHQWAAWWSMCDVDETCNNLDMYVLHAIILPSMLMKNMYILGQTFGCSSKWELPW